VVCFTPGGPGGSQRWEHAAAVTMSEHGVALVAVRIQSAVYDPGSSTLPERPSREPSRGGRHCTQSLLASETDTDVPVSEPASPPPSPEARLPRPSTITVALVAPAQPARASAGRCSIQPSPERPAEPVGVGKLVGGDGLGASVQHRTASGAYRCASRSRGAKSVKRLLFQHSRSEAPGWFVNLPIDPRPGGPHQDRQARPSRSGPRSSASSLASMSFVRSAPGRVDSRTETVIGQSLEAPCGNSAA
jgi:hypothetical protein